MSKSSLPRNATRSKKLSQKAPTTTMDNPSTSLPVLSTDELIASSVADAPVENQCSLDLQIAALRAEQVKKEE